MDELALHILDIVQNSISAGAKKIFISISFDDSTVKMEVTDNGCGMDREMINKVTDPFTTSRTTRKVGLGIPLLKETCELTGGRLIIKSQKTKGTKISASFGKNSFDRPPLGNMGQTMAALISCNPFIDFEFSFESKNDRYVLATNELKQVLGDVPVSNPQIAAFIERDVNSGVQSVCREDIL